MRISAKLVKVPDSFKVCTVKVCELILIPNSIFKNLHPADFEEKVVELIVDSFVFYADVSVVK